MAIKPIDRRALMRSVDIFAQITDPELEQLLSITTTKRVKKRDTLCRKGEPSGQMYAVMQGRLRATGEGPDGKEVVFTFHDPGDVIGEISLLDQEPRSATVSAVEDSALLTLHRRDFIPFLEKNPRVAIQLGTVLAARIRRLSEHMEDTVFLGLAPRLAKRLMALAGDYGTRTEAGLKIDQKLPQHELGEMVGTSRESVNKQVRQWVEAGVVKMEKGYITILDIDTLEDLGGFTINSL